MVRTSDEKKARKILKKTILPALRRLLVAAQLQNYRLLIHHGTCTQICTPYLSWEVFNQIPKIKVDFSFIQSTKKEIDDITISRVCRHVIRPRLSWVVLRREGKSLTLHHGSSLTRRVLKLLHGNFQLILRQLPDAKAKLEKHNQLIELEKENRQERETSLQTPTHQTVSIQTNETTKEILPRETPTHQTASIQTNETTKEILPRGTPTHQTVSIQTNETTKEILPRETPMAGNESDISPEESSETEDSESSEDEDKIICLGLFRKGETKTPLQQKVTELFGETDY